MKKININIIGTIGCGKTTLMNAIKEKLLKETKDVIIEPEPSVTIPFINDALKHFYEDNNHWSYPLQLLVSAAQESYMQTLRESDYEYSLFDAAFSSDIYGYSHAKHGRMSLTDYHALLNVGRPFKFNYVIWIHEDKDTTIARLRKRNKRVEEGDMDPDKKDVAIDDFSYMDSHMEDFEEYMPVYLNRFKVDNPDVKIIELKHLPDIESEAYDKLVESICKEIEGV